jgi:uncharacterized membrane protein
MNDAHLHLMVNHFPIIVPIVGLLILIAGFFSKSDIVKRTALLVVVFGAIFTFPAMYTGEGAEEIAENLPGVTDNIIHRHEEKAETFAVFSYILGLLALVGFWASKTKKPYADIIAIGVMVVGLVALYTGKETGTSGGEIRHTEIRSDFKVASENKTESKCQDIEKDGD